MADKSVIAATWDFGEACVRDGWAAFEKGGTALDAVEQGAWNAEVDETNKSVGRGGIPNRDGVVQVDAAIMWGPGQQAGSVAALEGILHPVSVARRVMEKSPHVMLAGDGARRFALEQGFDEVDLLTPASREAWQKWRGEGGSAPVDHHENPENHDTIGMVAVDADGNVAASCSTSGAGYKHAGRVGDSPIIGSGLYVDNEVGAAAATGLGEDIMRYCSSFAVVAHMARGLAPQEACLALLEQVRRVDPRGLDASVFLIAVNKEGQYGAAGMRPGLPYAVCEQGKIQMHQGGWLET